VAGCAKTKFVKQTGDAVNMHTLKSKWNHAQLVSGNEIVNKVVGGVIPKNLYSRYPKALRGLKNRRCRWLPMVDVKVTIVYGSYPMSTQVSFI